VTASRSADCPQRNKATVGHGGGTAQSQRRASPVDNFPHSASSAMPGIMPNFLQSITFMRSDRLDQNAA
jgi:hypothetical protein